MKTFKNHERYSLSIPNVDFYKAHVTFMPNERTWLIHKKFPFIRKSEIDIRKITIQDGDFTAQIIPIIKIHNPCRTYRVGEVLTIGNATWKVVQSSKKNTFAVCTNKSLAYTSSLKCAKHFKRDSKKYLFTNKKVFFGDIIN